MPGIDNYVMDMKSTAYEAIEKAFVEERKTRDVKIDRAWAYYEGDHNPPLEVQSDGYNDNVIVNHVEALAEKVIDFLLGDGVAFDAGQAGADAADQDVRNLWLASRGPILQNNIALSGAIEGHCAVRLKPTQAGYPAITRLQQCHFAAFWDLFDMSRVVWYRLQYRQGNAGKRIDYVRGRLSEDNKTFDHALDSWTELTYLPDTQSPAGGPLGAESKWVWDGKPVVWGYPWSPIVDWQNYPAPNGYYGKNDVKSAIQLNDALNFILSNVMRIIKHYAAPKTVGIGFNTDELVATQVGGLFTVNKPRGEADIFNLEMQSDLTSSMRLAEIITAALWQSGGMVDPQTMKDKIGALTNFGLRVLFQDALKRTQRKQMLYEEALRAITLRGLELAGRPAPAALKVLWSNVLPQDDTAQVANAQMKLDMKIISKQTAAAELGYDWTQEQERMAQDGDDLGSRLLAAFDRGQ